MKVIFENCYLNDGQKRKLCEMCSDLNADWVKTSTGFGTGGATAADLTLMREHAPQHVQVKASGGIRDLDTISMWLDRGVARVILGTVAVEDPDGGVKPPRQVPLEQALREFEKLQEREVGREGISSRDRDFLRRYFELLRRAVQGSGR